MQPVISVNVISKGFSYRKSTLIKNIPCNKVFKMKTLMIFKIPSKCDAIFFSYPLLKINILSQGDKVKKGL